MTWDTSSFIIGLFAGMLFVVGDIWLFIKFGPKCPPNCPHCRLP